MELQLLIRRQMMMRLTPILAMAIGLGLSVPALAASQGSGQMEGSQGSSQSKMQQQQAMHQAHRMVIGEVTDVRGVQIKGAAGDKHRLLKLSANEDTVVIVDLGAMPEQAFKDLGINKGTRIWALGSSARINGKPVLYARYVGEVYDFKPNVQGG
ncbi:MAG: hypothetical protein L0H73_05980 [Nitrococcus sp.]|nr:hypothetical protein [Nitrococcus sp.]